MSGVTLDGNTNVSNWSSSSSTVVNLTTTKTDDIIVVAIAMEPGGAANRNVTSITDTAGLVWANRSKIQYTSGYHASVEVWWAHAAAVLTNDAITITLDGAIDDACVCAFAVNGLDIAAPWDTDVALPATSATASGGVNVNYATAQSGDLLLAVSAGAATGVTSTTPAGWTNLMKAVNGGGTSYCSILVDYQLTGGPTSGSYDGMSSTSNLGVAVAVDALTSNTAPPARPASGGLSLMGIG